ncbi:Uncharacterized protein Adt_11949 [Abeliophyllum distichum]|uniref:Uncharacterized protein n=1 Tax=Abeliophyllum distichum TaxID=126358 RepID=A0ABD1UQS8_9LAMI
MKKNTPTVDFRELPYYLKKFMEFLVVDTHSAYDRVLERPTLKDLQAITSIHHLAMKFLKLCSVAKICNNQTKARACYMNDLQKAAKHKDAPLVVMMVQKEPMDVDLEKVEEEIILDEDLDTQIIGPDSLASTIEELETFLVNPSDPTQMPEVGQKLDKGRVETVPARKH